MRAIVWLKRDLRLEDSRVFEKAREFREVVPVFIFDEEILSSLKAYDERLTYIIKALELIPVKVYTFKGKTEDVFRALLERLKPDAVITQKAYSWEGEVRDQKVRSLCSKLGVKFLEVFDGFVVKPEDVPVRKVFTPFYKEWVKRIDLNEAKVYPENINVPKLDLRTFDPKELLSELSLKSIPFPPQDCHERLRSFNFMAYENTRNFPYLDGSSKLSPCIRFGVLSIRQVYKAGMQSEAFIRELAWREFWYHIRLNFPWTKGLEFQEKRRGVKWENREEFIRAFFEARTGYPIVDAGVRQLLQEKWVHNRIRMILGSFLTKDLLVDWRMGEEFFKHNLLDYDEVVNVGNWQWVASVGADPKPMRIFNPVLQSQRFDPECRYIKKYLPELSKLPCHMLHDPLTHPLPYHKPMVNHYERAAMARAIYRID